MKIFLKTALLFTASLTMSVSAHAGETLELNKTQILRLSQPAAAVIIGNPQVADISVQSDKTLFMIGRGYGETNILILDAYDNVLLESVITVVPPRNRQQVNVIMGNEGTQSYHCAPYCQPAPQLGNSPDFISSSSGKAGAANGDAVLSGSGGSNTTSSTSPSAPAGGPTSGDSGSPR